MSEDPDLERRLEAMFSSTRPRRDFEAELWKRIEAERPWYRRLGRRFQPALRYAPALATLLVVGLGVTWLANNFHGSVTTSSSTAGAPAHGGEKAVASFGVLPALSSTARSAAAPQATTGSADSEAGVNFTGPLPGLPSALPVYRYDEPSAADRARIDAALQAQSGLAAVVVSPSDVARGLEPRFLVSAPASGGLQGGTAESANAFLSSHNLLPRFAFELRSGSSPGQVLYARLFDGPAGSIRQVRPDGTPAGLTVDSSGGTVSASGPLELPLASASYPLRPASDSLSAARLRSGPGSAAFDRAELVYVLVVSGGHGYYEPELLLTGPGGSTLVAVVAPAWLGA